MESDIIDQLLNILRSPTAYYIYSWLAVALVLLASLGGARMLLRIAGTFSEAEVLRRYPGPAPTRTDSINQRISDLKRHAKNTALTVSMRSIGLLIVGLVVPGFVLASLVIYQDWFLPGPTALATNGIGVAADELRPYEIGIFLADQALRGGLADSFEVFGLGFSPIENNPDNLTYSGIILAYRMLAGAVMLSIGYLGWRVFVGQRHVQHAIRRLEDGETA